MAERGSADPQATYSVREVSEMFGLSPRQVRSLVADGILTPRTGSHGKFLFSFGDLVVLRGVADLVASGVPVSRIRAAVTALRGQLPADIGLAEARLDAAAGRVVVHLDEGTWEPDTGQTVLDFDTSELVDRADAVVDARAVRSPNSDTAAAWYAYADDIEEADPLEAERAYRTAIELDPGFADAQLNLGRLLHAGGAVAEALEHYRAAMAIDASDATTHYNIGVAAQDLGMQADAIAAYEEAIRLAPEFADARFNLAALYEGSGQQELALRHLRRYREIVRSRR